MLVASLVTSPGIAVLLMEDLSMLLERLATNAESLVTCKDFLSKLLAPLLTFEVLATAHRRLLTVNFLVMLSILVLPLRLRPLHLSHSSLWIATV